MCKRETEIRYPKMYEIYRDWHFAFGDCINQLTVADFQKAIELPDGMKMTLTPSGKDEDVLIAPDVWQRTFAEIRRREPAPGAPAFEFGSSGRSVDVDLMMEVMNATLHGCLHVDGKPPYFYELWRQWEQILGPAFIEHVSVENVLHARERRDGSRIVIIHKDAEMRAFLISGELWRKTFDELGGEEIDERLENRPAFELGFSGRPLNHHLVKEILDAFTFGREQRESLREKAQKAGSLSKDLVSTKGRGK